MVDPEGEPAPKGVRGCPTLVRRSLRVVNRGQTAALWIAAVSLAVLAVFSTLNYLGDDSETVPAWEVQVRHRIEAWSCVNAYIGTLEIEGYSFGLPPSGSSTSEILDLLDNAYFNCLTLVARTFPPLEE